MAIKSSSILLNAVDAASETAATESKTYFVVISYASSTNDKGVGVVKGTAFDEYCNGSRFECKVARETKIPPVTKASLERLQSDGYFLDYPDPILGRTAYDVTVTDGLVTKVQRVWTDAEEEQMNAKIKQNVLNDYAKRFKKGGNN